MTDSEYADTIVADWGTWRPSKDKIRKIIIEARIHARMAAIGFAAHGAPTKPENRISFVPAEKDRLR